MTLPSAPMFTGNFGIYSVMQSSVVTLRNSFGTTNKVPIGVINVLQVVVSENINSLISGVFIESSGMVKYVSKKVMPKICITKLQHK